MRTVYRILDLLVPDHCLLCEITLEIRPKHLLCPHCWAALPRNISACQTCARQLPSPGICGSCQLEPLVSGKTIAPLNHTGEAKHLIHQLKYQQDLRAGQALANLIADEVNRDYGNLPQCLLPIPLSYIRQVQRGYNQAAWLAHDLSQRLNIPMVRHAFTRRHEPAQHTLSRKARLRPMTKSFRQKSKLTYSHMAIIDDVLTTGATCRALARLLEKQGVKRIDIWCATRSQAG